MFLLDIWPYEENNICHMVRKMLNVYSAGLIVPDLPFEESADLKREAAKKNIDMVGWFVPSTS